MRRTMLGALALVGLTTAAIAAPGLPGGGPKVKTPAVEAPEVPSVPSMTVDGILNAIEGASTKLDKSALTLFDAEMSLLEALGNADAALKYRSQIEDLKAQAASEERDAEMMAVITDEAVLEEILAALKDKQNEMDDARKQQARKATLNIAMSRLMALATSEDAGTVGLATMDMSQRVAEGDETTLTDIGRHASNPGEFVSGIKRRASRIKENSGAYAAQSKSVKKVMDKYNKKKSMFSEISTADVQSAFESSGF